MNDPPTQDPDSIHRQRAEGKVRTSSRAPSSGRLSCGAIFAGKYEVRESLGEGACGTVYAARSLHDRRDVALKVIHPHLASHPQVSKRFLREASILGQLHGEHIARIYDCGQDDDGLLYMALEHVEGEPLSELAARDPQLPVEVVVDLMLAVCDALHDAHSAGIIHRDLKPDNVIVKVRDGVLETVRVLDFGLSKMLHGHLGSTNLTEQNMVLGTPEYMAPEQARGDEVDGRCDLYAAGVILYELLCGKLPFRSKLPLAVMTAQLTEPPPPLAARRSGQPVPPAVAAVAMHALAKKRAERYPDAASMADALRQARLAPDDVDAVRPVPSGRESVAQRDTDWNAVGHADTLLAIPSGRPMPSLRPNPKRWLDWIPAWVAVSVVAAIIGVLVGVLVALRC